MGERGWPLRSGAVLVGGLFALGPATGALAQGLELGRGDRDALETGEVTFDFFASVVVDPSGASGVSGSSAPSPFVWISIPRFSSSGDLDDDNMGLCTRLDWIQVPREEAADRQAQARASYLSSYAGLGLNNEGYRDVPCPQDPSELLPAAVVEDAIRGSVSEQLPRPTLSLPPGFALTGLQTYLVTEHDLAHEASLTVDLGITQLQVDLQAAGTMTVDWGDGTVTEHQTGGTGYPDGAVNHVYESAGVVDITTTDVWSITYDAGVIAGTLEAPLAPVVLEGVEVQQRQGVRTQ